MSESIVIAIDAMGGDAGPAMVLPGVERATERHPGAKFLLFGDRAKLEPLMSAKLHAQAEIRHCDAAVAMNEKPSQALLRGRRVSSMWQAVDAVRSGHAQVVVSAGNTGALMAMAKVLLDTMPGIQRPAIAAIWPTFRGESVVLDVGATIGADAEQLVDFAIMGEAMARCLLGIERPTVGLLNVGVEEIKGIEEVREADRRLRSSALPIEYKGFVEGDDLGKGTVDVVVTEGFTGNIALKTAEGTARQIAGFLKSELMRTAWTKLGAWLAKDAFDALKEKLDPRTRNGGVLLGLNGLVVKSHGGTDPIGFAAAINVAVEMVESHVVEKIRTDLDIKADMKADPASASGAG
ncbi:MAG: phosphate acyltransferase PlsX [Hyphomicrobiales bacterium]